MPRDPSLRFWGAGRVLVQLRGRWELRSWPDWHVLQSGRGSATPEPAGERLAVATGERTISVTGGPRQELPDTAGGLVDMDWSGPGLVAATRATPPQEPGSPTAHVFGTPPPERHTLWSVSLDGTPPRQLFTAPPGSRIASVHGRGDLGALVECAEDTDPRTLGTRRLHTVDPTGRSSDLAPDLPGSTSQVAVGPGGQLALLHADFPHHQLVAPMGARVLIGGEGGWQSVLPDSVRVWGTPTWTADGHCLLVTAFDGIRLGVVTVEMASGRWGWSAVDAEGSYRCPAQATPGGELLAIWQPLRGQASLVAITGTRHRQLQPLGQPTHPRGSSQVHPWHGPDGPLEGVLATPATGGPPWPLVVDLHGGPVGSLIAGDPATNQQLEAWTASGFAALAPDYRGSGVLGVEPMLAAFRGDGLPEDDREARDVLSGVESLIGAGIADAQRLYVFGHGYGAYLLNRILTRDHRFRAAVCWEGVADLRLLDVLMGGTARQRAWRGGTPWQTPQRWAAASPSTAADQIRTPMLLVYGQDGMGPTHGVAWYTTLRDHDVPVELVLYGGEGHGLHHPANSADLFTRAVDWFTNPPASPEP